MSLAPHLFYYNVHFLKSDFFLELKDFLEKKEDDDNEDDDNGGIDTGVGPVQLGAHRAALNMAADADTVESRWWRWWCWWVIVFNGLVQRGPPRRQRPFLGVLMRLEGHGGLVRRG